MRYRYPVVLLIVLLVTLVLSRLERVSASPFPTPPSPPDQKTRLDHTRWMRGIDYRSSFTQQERLATLSAPTIDQYGYTWENTTTFDWIDAASGGTQATGVSGDDNFAGPFNIGFGFKFYENIYTQVYISTNGFISLGQGYDSFSNDEIPADTPPNNILAPMWDDLDVGSSNNGRVYYMTGSDAIGQYFVVEWHEITRRVGGSSDLLTFEVILYETGDIVFQYFDLNGVLNEATVGIENADGSDGMLYLYNSPIPGDDIHFIRPPASPRVKALPAYQSAFVTSGDMYFSVAIQNIGEMGNDTFDLIASSSQPAWDVSLYAEDGQSVLIDNDADGLPDTGTLGQGEVFTITVECRPPDNAKAGDYTLVNLTAVSSIDDSKDGSVLIQSAIPASFAQAFADSSLGLNLSLSSEYSESFTKVKNWFSGPTLALSETPQGNYMYVWERNAIKEFTPPDYAYKLIFYSDVEYVLLDQFGNLLKTAQKLTNNEPGDPDELSTIDRVPVSAATPDGLTGVVWVRDIVDDQNIIDIKTNSNVYFAVLDANGNLKDPPGLIDVTQNTNWRGENDTDIPLFASPRITAISDSRFLIVWTDQRLLGVDDIVNNVYYAIYDTSSGIFVKSPTPLTDDPAYINRYYDPNVTSLTGNKAFVAYTINDYDAASYSIAYLVLDRNGYAVKQETEFTGNGGWGPDAVQLDTGKIALTWTNPISNRIVYALTNGTGYNITNSPVELSNPNHRQPDYVSVTHDKAGHGILTWMDAGWNHYLYYALIDDGGDLLTPPMIFHAGRASDPLILSSYSGYGIAPYEYAGQIFLPIITR